MFMEEHNGKGTSDVLFLFLCSTNKYSYSFYNYMLNYTCALFFCTCVILFHKRKKFLETQNLLLVKRLKGYSMEEVQ